MRTSTIFVVILISLVHVLQHASSLVTIEEWEWLAVLGTCSTITELADAKVQETSVVTQILKLVLQVSSIALNNKLCIANVPSVAELKLKTRVFHVTHVAYWFCLTHIRWDRHFH